MHAQSVTFLEYQQIEDYHVLANAIEWADYFNSFCKNQSDPKGLNLLDVGCGTGRWLIEFQNKLDGAARFSVKCDLMDPSSIALQSAAELLRSPLFVGEPIQKIIQEVELLPNNYDIIWAMHSFYSIPELDLEPVLKKCINGLKEEGSLFIALSPIDSFYIKCYEMFRFCYSIDQVNAYCSAERVQKAFQSLGLGVEVVKKKYIERVGLEDIQRLNHYILNECIGYSFDRDNSVTTELNVLDLLNHSTMGAFLKSHIVDDHYEFPQELWLFHWVKLPEFQ